MKGRNFYTIDLTEKPSGKPADFNQPCLILWQTVVKQVVEEARLFSTLDGKRAQNWLFQKSRDRDIVFQLAGMSIEFWIEGMAKRLVANAQAWLTIDELQPTDDLVTELCKQGLRKSPQSDLGHSGQRDLKYFVRREKKSARRFLMPTNYVWEVLRGM